MSKVQESLDTNIILRIMLRDVPEQCMKVVDLLMRQGVNYRISDLAITEAVYVLQGLGQSRAEIVERFQGLFELTDIEANRELFERVFRIYLENANLSFNDCYLAVEARVSGAEPLWTFDKALAKKVESVEIVR